MATPAAPANAAALLELARACRERGDSAGEAQALDRLLAAEPRHIPALVRRADLYAAAGDARSASSFYLMALRSAPATGVPKETATLLARAKEACDRFAIDYRDYLLRSLAAKGFDPASSSPRFAQSVDLILGQKRIYLQQPKYYYFPGPASGPVLRAEPLPVVRRRGSGATAGHPRRARSRARTNLAHLHLTSRAMPTVRRMTRWGC